MIEIEIDGKTVQAKEGSMIIEVADNNGVHIPRFCYHKKLSIAANCRMCLVEVEKAPKTLPACATPIAPNMKIFTKSPKAIESQRAVMEFLLINHPLDCPVCDQGGQCELQDVALGYGEDASSYTQTKRAVEDEDLGSLVATDMTRCIQCTRCVRFGTEIAGVRELGVMGRGEHSEISTYIQHSLQSELSGNIIDVCPVGALTSKPFRFRARAWELHQHPTVSPHDSLGSNLYAHTHHGKVVRMVPRENEAINEVWLSDRDRFSYAGLNSSDRLTQPMIKRDGKWQAADWTETLTYVAERLQRVKAHHGAQQIGAMIAPLSTVEEHYLLQRLMLGLGSKNTDHRLRRADFSQLPCSSSVVKIADLEKVKAGLLIGCDIRREQPLLNHRLRNAVLHGGKISCVNSMDYDFNYDLHEKIIVHPLKLVLELAGILKALLASPEMSSPAELQTVLATVTVTPKQQAIADSLLANEDSMLLLGATVIHHPQAAKISYLAEQIAQLSKSALVILTGPNSRGIQSVSKAIAKSQDYASLPAGLNLHEMLENKLQAYILFNVEPELDCANPNLVTQALSEADFVVSLSPFKGGLLDAQANVLLPIAPFTETEGTFVNLQKDWQSVKPVTQPLGEARPGWKVLRVLANLLDIPGFEYLTAEQIRDEVKALVESELPTESVVTKGVEFTSLTMPIPEITRITEWPMYRNDLIVRRSEPLQNSGASESLALRINTNLAKYLQLKEGEQAQVIQNEQKVELPVVIDERVPDHCAYVAAGFSKSAKLGDSFGAIEIRKI